MAEYEFKPDNPNTKIVMRQGVVTITNTGGWFDIWVYDHHLSGTLDLAEAVRIMGNFK